jgi:hypothetical protein
MTWYRRVLGFRVSPPWLDVRLGQGVCFLSAPVLLGVTPRAISRLATTPAEAFLMVQACLSTALLIVILGMVLPLAQRGARADP